VGEVVSLFVDGGCTLGNPSKYAAQWAFCHVDAEGKQILERSGVILRVTGANFSVKRPDRVIIVPTEEINADGLTNQLSELVALTLGMESLPVGWSGHVYSDSESALGRMFRNSTMGGIPEEWQHRCKIALGRLGHCDYTLLGGHPTKADLECGIRAAKPGKRALPCSIHQHWADLECQRLAKRFVAIMNERNTSTKGTNP
jgi:hypothetical protein